MLKNSYPVYLSNFYKLLQGKKIITELIIRIIIEGKLKWPIEIWIYAQLNSNQIIVY